MLLGHVDARRRGRGAAPARCRVDVGAHRRPSARCRRVRSDAELDLASGPVAASPGRRASRADALAVVGMDAIRRSHSAEARARAAASQRSKMREHLRVPVGARPDRWSSSRCRRRRRAMRRRAGAPAPRRWRRCSTRSVMSSATPTNAIGSPVCVALDDAARQHVAPAAVGAPVARLHVGRLVAMASACSADASDQRDVVGMDERAHLVDRQALGPRRHAAAAAKARSL